MPLIKKEGRSTVMCSSGPPLPFGEALPIAAVSQATQNVTKAILSIGDFLAGASGTSTKQSHAAKQLKTALANYGTPQQWKDVVLGVVVPVTAAISMSIQPQGTGVCDHNAMERCCNCATSVPYVLAGVHAMQERKMPQGRAWGASTVGVGLASIGFHASSGKWKKLGRRMDYWTIAMSSSMLTRAVYPNVPPAVTALGLAMTPFKPFLVSFLNSSAMEVKFLQRAQQNKELRKAHKVHAATCLLGLGAFALEEFMPELPLVHSTWHCLSAAAVCTVNHLLHDIEKQHPKLCDK